MLNYAQSRMDIRQLQYLVALAREKHFTRAASDWLPSIATRYHRWSCARPADRMVFLAHSNAASAAADLATH